MNLRLKEKQKAAVLIAFGGFAPRYTSTSNFIERLEAVLNSIGTGVDEINLIIQKSSSLSNQNPTYQSILDNLEGLTEYQATELVGVMMGMPEFDSFGQEDADLINTLTSVFIGAAMKTNGQNVAFAKK